MDCRRGVVRVFAAVLCAGALGFAGCGGGGATSAEPTAPTPTPTPTPKDAIPMSEIAFTSGDANPSAFPATATLEIASLASNRLCINKTHPVDWPIAGGVAGNIWVFARIGGQWRGGTFETMRPGNESQCVMLGIGGAPVPFPAAGGDISRWMPQSGEMVGFMISTLARGRATPGVTGRSLIVSSTWP